jgi:outer membrane biosynthesis protein TonB
MQARWVLLLLSLVHAVAVAEDAAPSLPKVTAFECPRYPSKAESTRLQGSVVMQVKTDGSKVSDVTSTSGHPILISEATNNVRTWRFAEHTPTTFKVTYFYVAEGRFKPDPDIKCAAVLDLPTKVTVSTKFSIP